MATDGPRTHLTPDDPADTVLVSALVSEASYSRAADLAGVSKATVKRRMATPEFRRRVEELRADHVRRTEQRLGELAGEALDALEALLADAEAPAQRLGAARTVIEGLLRFREAGEVQQRLDALEVRLVDSKLNRLPGGAMNGHDPLRQTDRTDKTREVV